MQLLNWKSNPSQIQETLKRIMLVEGEEVVKFLQDILDALDWDLELGLELGRELGL